MIDYGTEVGALGQVPSDKAIGVFVSASLPGCVGMSEKAFYADSGGNFTVHSVFRTIVQSEGFPGLFGEVLKPLYDGFAGGLGGLSLKLGEVKKPAFSFHQGVEGRAALARYQAVTLPVAKMETFFHRAGSHVYGYTTGYLGLSLLSTRALGFTLTVVPSQASYKIQAAVGVGMVNILVDGLMAYGEVGMVDIDFPGDLLRRPSFFELGSDVRIDSIILKPGPPGCLFPPIHGSSVCSVGEI